MQIRLQGLSKSFDNVQVIHPIDLVIESSQLTTLLGPSGCGKTTLLRMIAGLETPDQGEIFFDNQCVFSHEQGINLTPEQRELGFVFQDFALWPHMTVYDNVAFGLRARKKTQDLDKKVMTALDSVQLEDFHDRYPHQLSGGQQQRVAFARAIVIEPACILFDEPLSALDALLREEMRVELRRLIDQWQLTAIFVTHDQLEAFEIADNIILMNQGKIVQQGTAQELYYTPANEFVLSFIGSSYQEKQQYIRPEYVSINNEKIGYHGVVESIIFQGPTSKILIRLDSGKMVESLKLSHQVNVDIGDDIFVQFNLSDIPSHPS